MSRFDLDKRNSIVKSLGLTFYHLVYEYELTIDQMETVERDIIEAMLMSMREDSRTEIIADMLLMPKE